VAPSFDPNHVADAMDAVMENYLTMQARALEMKFKTWSDVCGVWLDDLRAAS